MNVSQSINFTDPSINNIHTLYEIVPLEEDDHLLAERVEMATYSCREEAFGMAGGCSAAFGIMCMVIGGGLWTGGKVNSTVSVAGQAITGIGMILFVSGIALGCFECYYKQKTTA